MGACLFIYFKNSISDWFLTLHVYIMNYTIIHTASALLTSNSMVGSKSSKMLNNKISTSVAARNYRAYERQFHHLRWFKIRFVNSILDSKREHTFTYNEHSLFAGVRICLLLPATQHTYCWNMCFRRVLWRPASGSRAPRCSEISDIGSSRQSAWWVTRACVCRINSKWSVVERRVSGTHAAPSAARCTEFSVQ